GAAAAPARGRAARAPARAAAGRSARRAAWGSRATAFHPDPRPWVDDDVDEIDEEVGDEHPDDDEEEDPLDHEVVLVRDRAVDLVAEPRVREHDLGDERAGDDR